MSRDQLKKQTGPLSLSDWLRALPWLLLMEAVYLIPYLFKPGGVAAKYIWDEHCVSHTYPAAWLARAEFRSGFFPLWNPMSGCGLPLLGNTLDETILPYAVVKYLLPFPAGLNLFIAIKLLIALTGAFALARQLGASRRGAILGSVVFAFTGINTLNINSVIASVFMLPWCVFAMHRLATRPRLGSALLVSLAFGLSLLGGNPQIPFEALVIGCGLYLCVLRCGRAPISLGRYLLLPAAAVCAGVIWSAPQLLPLVEYLSRAFSHHLPGYGSLHLDPRGIIGIISPWWDQAIVMLSGREMQGSFQSFIAARFPPASYADASVPMPFEHLGMAAVFFLIMASINLRRLSAEAAFFIAVGIGSLGLAFGIFPFSLIAHLPPFNQVSNWRFTTFTAALACSALAAIMLTRLELEKVRGKLPLGLAALAVITAGGMALVESRAGLPMNSAAIMYPLIATSLTFCLLAAVLITRRQAALIVFAALELLIYDRVMDHPLFPHPLRALDHPGAVTACVSPDPDYRFIAYDEVIHPNLGIMLDRYDFRSYEMIFPETLVEWIEAMNGWDHKDAVTYYLSHYYFSPEAEALTSPEAAKASIKSLLAQQYLPADPVPDLISAARMTAPSPDYFHLARVDIKASTRSGWFQHAPSSIEIRTPENFRHGGITGYVAISPDAWDLPGDGAQMLMTAVKTGAGPRLLYSRHLDPKSRAEERGWKGFPLEPVNGGTVAAAVLPGPKNDPRSDYALWADFHDQAKRKAFERTWELVSAGDTKCYRNREARPRFRTARSVAVVRDFEDCLAGVGKSAPADTETVVDESGQDWPAGPGRVVGVQWGANRITAELEMDAPGTVVLADTYYPGWQALVNGVPERIYRADCVFRAVRAPEGKARVEFRFVPLSFRLGLWCGITSWLAAVVFIAWRRWHGGESETGE